MSESLLKQIISDFDKSSCNIDPITLAEICIEACGLNDFMPELAEYELSNIVDQLITAAACGHPSAVTSLLNIATKVTKSLEKLARVADNIGDRATPIAPPKKTLPKISKENINSIRTKVGTIEYLQHLHDALNKLSPEVLRGYANPIKATGNEVNPDEDSDFNKLSSFDIPRMIFSDDVMIDASMSRILQVHLQRNSAHNTVKTVRSSLTWPVLRFGIADLPFAKLPEPVLFKSLAADWGIRNKKTRGSHREFENESCTRLAFQILNLLEAYREQNRPLAASEMQYSKNTHDHIELFIGQLKSSAKKSGSRPFYELVADHLVSLQVFPTQRILFPLMFPSNDLEVEIPLSTEDAKAVNGTAGRDGLRIRWEWKAYQLPRLDTKNATIAAWVEAAIAVLEWHHEFVMTVEELPWVVGRRLKGIENPQSKNRKNVYLALKDVLERGFRSLAHDA